MTLNDPERQNKGL